MKLHPEVIKYINKNVIKAGKARWKGVSKSDRSKAMREVRMAGIAKAKKISTG
jgi:hypothetical protein